MLVPCSICFQHISAVNEEELQGYALRVFPFRWLATFNKMDGSTKDLKDTYGVGGPVFCFPVGPGVVTGRKTFSRAAQRAIWSIHPSQVYRV